MESKRLDSSALAAGISPNYINAHGKPQAIGAETKRRLLDAMNSDVAPKAAAKSPLPPVLVVTKSRRMQLTPQGRGEYTWLLTSETGEQFNGVARGGEALTLPAKLTEGYHTLTLTREESRWPCRLIVAPKRCYEPQALRDGKKLWGAACSFIRCAQKITGVSAISAI